MAKITYEDKEFLNKNENIADKNKVNDTDLNQIKEVVNENDGKVGDLSDLNTSEKSNVVEAINSNLPTVLYENSDGSTGNITLSDSIDNYSAIEIFYKSDGDGNFSSTKILNPFTRAALITMIINLSGNYRGVFLRMSQVALSGNQLTVEKNGQLFGGGTSVNNGTSNNNVRIIKVLGYK